MSEELTILDKNTRKVLDLFWSRELGVSVKDLKGGEIKVVGVERQSNVPPSYPLIAMKVYGGCIISVQNHMVDTAREVFQDLSIAELFSTVGIGRIRRLMGDSIRGIVYWLHLYCDKASFRPHEKHGARRLTEADRKMCEKWHIDIPRAIGPFSYQFANPVPYGIIVNEDLVSVSLILRYDLPFLEIAIETRPDYRGRGYAKSAVSKATKGILSAGKIAWYYLDYNPANIEGLAPTNIASLKVAKALGYYEYSEAFHCALPRFK